MIELELIHDEDLSEAMTPSELIAAISTAEDVSVTDYTDLGEHIAKPYVGGGPKRPKSGG